MSVIRICFFLLFNFLVAISGFSSSIKIGYHSPALWECEDTAIIESYIMSDGVARVRINSYHFDDETLILESEVVENIKGVESQLLTFTFDHPTAYFDHQFKLKWMDKMVSNEYLIYLNLREDNTWIINICSRLIAVDDCRASEEINLLRIVKEFGFQNYWIDNSRLDAPFKAEPIEIEEIINAEKGNFDELEGYPVGVLNILLSDQGKVLDIISRTDKNFEVTEENQLLLSSISDHYKPDSYQLFFIRISKELKWQPARSGTVGVKCMVPIRWEVTDDKELVFRLL
ncbi:MAG: hypothetical protein R8G66_25970 [Cytophagales bacterium]|nr:hypothetical protein [Cytophagales bacterium]